MYLCHMKLSVVIPVYNVAQTLRKCVESVLQQEVDNMEIILVDDGSPDECPKICDELATADQRIIVVHKSNGGLSDARNAGIETAKGDYLTFVDSDDEIEKGTLSPLLNILETHRDVDIIEYPASIKGEEELIFTEQIYTDTLTYWNNTKAYNHTYAWNKIYRSKLFDDIRFPQGKVFEDVWTYPQLLLKANNIATTSTGKYVYHENPKGITACADGNALLFLLQAYLECPYPIPLVNKINVQLDVYALTGKILLADTHTNEHGSDILAKIKILLYKTFGIKKLCKIHKILIRR